MKKILALFTAVALMILFTACGATQKVDLSENDNPIVQTESQNTVEQAESDQNDNTSSLKIETSSELYDSFVPSIIVSLDGDTNISLGTKAQILADHGWEFDGDESLEPNTIMPSITCKYNGQYVFFSSMNDTEKTITVKEGTISHISIKLWKDDYSAKYDSAPNFSLDGKINNDSTLEDILKTYGNPFRVNNLKSGGIELYYRDKDNNSLRIALSEDGSEIYSVQINLGVLVL